MADDSGAGTRAVNIGETIASIFIGPGTLSQNERQISFSVPNVAREDGGTPSSTDAEVSRRSLPRTGSIRISVRRIPSARLEPVIEPSTAERISNQGGLLAIPSSDEEMQRSVVPPVGAAVNGAPVLAKEASTMNVFGHIVPKNWRKLSAFAWVNFKTWLWESWTHWLVVLWMIAVVVDGAILFLALIQAFSRHLTKDETTAWIEVTSQIMNALFMIPAVLTNPERLRHFYLYFKDRGLLKQERGHPADMPDMLTLTVVILLNLNNIFQYCLAGFMWGYPVSTRPPSAVAIFLVSSFAAVAFGGILEARWIGRYAFGAVENAEKAEKADGVDTAPLEADKEGNLSGSRESNGDGQVALAPEA